MKKSPVSVLMISARADFGGGPEHVYRLLQSIDSSIIKYAAIPEDVPYYERICGILGKDHVLIIPHRKFSLLALIKIIQFIFLKNILIVHSHGKGAGVYSRPAAFFTSAVCIHTFHGVHIDKYSKLGTHFYLWYERFFSLFTDKFIVTGEGEKKEVLKSKLAPDEKMALIYNGVTIPSITVQFPENNSFNIVTVTRFDEAKNPALLLPIIKAISESDSAIKPRLIIVGDGAEKKQTEQSINELGLEHLVHFTGAIKSVDDVYLKSFCYLSTSKMEGLPLSVLEALSFGIPCIVTDVPGNNDLIRPGYNGFLFPLQDPVQAAKAIYKLMVDSALWHFFSRNAREQIVDQFSVSMMSEKISVLYKQSTANIL